MENVSKDRRRMSLSRVMRSLICLNYRLPKITLWPTHDPIDGYICQAVDSTTAASEILSKYFERPVHIVYKGPRPRRVDVTTMFPDLQATSVYQDMYPLLVLSEESIEEMETELRGYVGSQGIDEKWRKDRLLIERYVWRS